MKNVLRRDTKVIRLDALRGLFWLGILFVSEAIPGNDVRLIPSHHPVKSVVLSWFSGVMRTVVDSRFELIRDIHKQFPAVSILVNSDLSEPEAFKRLPQLKTMVHSIVRSDVRNIQDPYEFAWDTKEQAHVPLVFGISGIRGLQSNLTGWGLPSGIVIDEGTRPADGFRRNAGGNVEVLPDGTAIVGSTASRQTVEKLAHYSTGSRVMIEDTAWLNVGDIDEIFLWTSDPAGKSECLLFTADVLEGKKLVTEETVAEAKKEALLYFTKIFSETAKSLGLALSEDFMNHPQTDIDHKAQSQIRAEIGAYDDLLAAKNYEGIELIQERIDHAAGEILAARSMRACRRIRVPLVFTVGWEDHHKDCSREKCQYSPAFYNQINSLVIENHLYSFKPNLPALRRKQESIFEENGFTVHWYDKKGANSMAGGVHCSSNTMRLY